MTTTRLVAVPWAPWDEDLSPDGRPTITCPACGLRIAETNLKGTRYIRHYNEQHMAEGETGL